MKSIFGNNVIISIFGESHSPLMGVTIHNLKAGIKIDEENIKADLALRRPVELYSNARVEEDDYEIISGYFNGFTTGAPLTFLVKNKNYKTDEYQEGIIRPSQSDYGAYIKSHGYNDYRGGGHLSGRLTVLFVIVGAIFKQILSKHDIHISSELVSLGGVTKLTPELTGELIQKAKNSDETLGGIIKVIVKGVEAGVGEPIFDSVESVASHLFFSIPAVKAVEFGLGKDFSSQLGSEVLDEMKIVNGKTEFIHNFNGGVIGGITNGADIISYVTFKPTPTIPQELNSIDIKNNKNIVYKNNGHHDCAIVLRAGVICEACMAIALLDLLITLKGNEWM